MLSYTYCKSYRAGTRIIWHGIQPVSNPFVTFFLALSSFVTLVRRGQGTDIYPKVMQSKALRRI